MTIDPAEPVTVYVAITSNGYPIGASGHLGDVQAHAEKHEARHDSEPRAFRWDETNPGKEWQLMAVNAHTRRWNKTLVTVHATPIVDAPPLRWTPPSPSA